MEPVLLPEEMTRADQATIASGVHAFELMDRAAFACSSVALRHLRGAYGREVTIVAGKGNNGGDGIAMAGHLAAAGVRTEVFLLGEPTGDPARHLRLARSRAPRGRLNVRHWSRAAFDAAAGRADLIVDAVFGTGFTGSPRGDAAEAITALAGCRRPVLSVDMPSGVSGGDGAVGGVAVSADLTVAIQALKVGHVTGPGSARCGRIFVADIGIAVGEAPTLLPSKPDVARALPRRRTDAHKYNSGVVAVLAGAAGMTGAATLCARGAVHGGAGLVFVGTPEGSLAVLETAVTEAVKIALPSRDGALVADSVDGFEPWIARAGALAFGPGIGRGPGAPDLVRRVLQVNIPVVIDADGLTVLADVLSGDPDLLARRTAPTVLTPHAGEYARLAGRASAPQWEERLERARSAAQRWRCVVHLKGPRAVTASPDGRVVINPTGNPGMATGGTGDVLTGVIAALLSTGMSAEQACWVGAYVHGLAGDIAAGRESMESLTAVTLLEALGSAFRAVRQRQDRTSGPIRELA